MENKNQIYLLSFIMYLIVGLAGYINQFFNYWLVLVASILVTAYTLSLVFFNSKEVKEETKFEWVSVSAFCCVEVIVAIYVAVVKVPYVGIFKYTNYLIQILGLGFAMYAVIRYVLTHTSYVSMIKEKINEKQTLKSTSQTVDKVEENKEVTSEIKETIKEETTIENTEVEVVTEPEAEENENEVIGIECIQEEEIKTPYMEEEI